MTSKFYLRVMMAAMALLFAAVGCKDSSDDDTPPPTGKYTFSISVDGVTATEASVKVTPDKAEAVYYCSVIKKSRFDEFKSDADYLKDDIEYLKSQAKAQNVSFEAYLKTVVNTGSQPVKFVSLEPSTDYYAYVYGITTAGQVTSDLKKVAFMTEQGSEPEPDGLDFEFVVENITKTAADVSVIPSNDEDTYYFDVQSVAAFKDMSEAEIDAYIISQVDAEYLSQGPDGFPAELFDQLAPLTPGTDYYVFAVGYDAGKEEATTKPKMYKFTTETPTGTAPDLELAAQPGDVNGQNTATKIYCSALSLAAVSGTYTCLPKTAVDDLIGKGASLGEISDANGKPMDEQFLGYLTEDPGVGLTLSKLQPSTAYTVIFNVRSAGGMSTAKRADVTTTAEQSVDPSNMTFKVDVTNIGAKTASIKVTPSNDQETYFFDVQEKAIIDKDFADDASLVAALNAAYAQYGGLSKLVSKGADTYDAKTLLPGTEYYVLVFGYTTGATTPVLRQKFVTQTAAKSGLSLAAEGDQESSKASAPLAMQSKKGVMLSARAKAGQIEQSFVVGQTSTMSNNEVRSLKSAAKMSSMQLRVRTPRL